MNVITFDFPFISVISICDQNDSYFFLSCTWNCMKHCPNHPHISAFVLWAHWQLFAHRHYPQVLSLHLGMHLPEIGLSFSPVVPVYSCHQHLWRPKSDLYPFWNWYCKWCGTPHQQHIKPRSYLIRPLILPGPAHFTIDFWKSKARTGISLCPRLCFSS